MMLAKVVNMKGEEVSPERMLTVQEEFVKALSALAAQQMNVEQISEELFKHFKIEL